MNKKNIVWITLGTIGSMVILYGIFSLTSKSSSSQQINFYQASATDRPKIKADKHFQNIGEMKVSDEKSTPFVLENVGTKPLQIFYGTTSCNCTFGQIKTKNGQSPIFGMHANQDFILAIAPGQKATLDVIYKPSLMPVYGKVQREAIIKTNDPDNPQIGFGIEAFVK